MENTALWVRTSRRPKPGAPSCPSLVFRHGGYLCQFSFLNYQGRWLWIFDTGHNTQHHMQDDDVAAFLDVSGRTVADWRTGRRQPDRNALLLLYITFAGFVMPGDVARKGYRFVGNGLHRNGEQIAP